MVDGYRVHPDGVNAVVQAVIGSAEPMITAAGELHGHAGSAATGSSSGIVGSALNDAFGVLGAQLQAVEEKIPAVLRGTAGAGRAVQHGDDQMADTIIGLATGALSQATVLRGMAGAGPR